MGLCSSVCGDAMASASSKKAQERYGPTVKGHEAKIKALFKKIDRDSNGYLVTSELKDVVSKYTGEAFNDKQFFEWFDVHGAGGEPDSQLDLKEFGWYLADICEGFDETPHKAMPEVIQKFEELIAGPEETRYGGIIGGHDAAIKALFDKIDANNNGYLAASELRDVVSKYTGEAFDENQFFGWFDVHGAGGNPDSQLDLKEFGWYVADIAEAYPKPSEHVAAIVQQLDSCCQ